ncbi:hypothetical protein UFOVP733_43 [uncultured Caudovirales phage]|uniref:Uncharacterized protein n=1 Tax=uncultured Caudovirales phage TaxID=2100421 RepID=A0A6J7X613_9CAUD|nr:hypothetical protein UFOVP733_43 [uncultured Caudovirales phage]CAB5224846.1 hypothetical protein UFOVP743_16 [uncultured Caudovirales phage]
MNPFKLSEIVASSFIVIACIRVGSFIFLHL